MKREFHVRFRENARVRFLCVTRLALILRHHDINETKDNKNK